MKMSLSLTGIMLLLTLSLGAMAAETAPIGGRGIAAGVSEVATVTAVDQDSRQVTLRTADGEEHSFVAGDEVRNLGQVKVGDEVTIIYAEALAVRLYPAANGSKGVIEKTEVSRAPRGAKPYGMITRHVEITARVTALDPKSRMVTLEGKNGELTLRVADDVDLDKVSINDTVRVDYLERISISVDTPKK